MRGILLRRILLRGILLRGILLRRILLRGILGQAHVHRLRTLIRLFDVEVDGVALFQMTISVAGDASVMDEYVAHKLRRLDETKDLF